MKGMRFSKVLVLGRSEERHRNGHVMWRCLCDCGTEFTAIGANIRRGIVSCGCLKRNSTRGKYITQERLRELLDYNPNSGVFIWKYNRGVGAKAGDIAGTLKEDGYVSIGVDGRNYLAHRLAWLYVYGVLPSEEIDHGDLDKQNNRIGNLSPATHAQNQQNKPLRKDSSSGLKGAFKNGRHGWCSRIQVDGVKYYLGTFRTPELAHAAYRDAAQCYAGRFARSA